MKNIKRRKEIGLGIILLIGIFMLVNLVFALPSNCKTADIKDFVNSNANSECWQGCNITGGLAFITSGKPCQNNLECSYPENSNNFGGEIADGYCNCNFCDKSNQGNGICKAYYKFVGVDCLNGKTCDGVGSCLVSNPSGGTGSGGSSPSDPGTGGSKVKACIKNDITYIDRDLDEYCTPATSWFGLIPEITNTDCSFCTKGFSDCNDERAEINNIECNEGERKCDGSYLKTCNVDNVNNKKCWDYGRICPKGCDTEKKQCADALTQSSSGVTCLGNDASTCGVALGWCSKWKCINNKCINSLLGSETVCNFGPFSECNPQITCNGGSVNCPISNTDGNKCNNGIGTCYNRICITQIDNSLKKCSKETIKTDCSNYVKLEGKFNDFGVLEAKGKINGFIVTKYICKKAACNDLNGEKTCVFEDYPDGTLCDSFPEDCYKPGKCKSGQCESSEIELPGQYCTELGVVSPGIKKGDSYCASRQTKLTEYDHAGKCNGAGVCRSANPQDIVIKSETCLEGTFCKNNPEGGAECVERQCIFSQQASIEEKTEALTSLFASAKFTPSDVLNTINIQNLGKYTDKKCDVTNNLCSFSDVNGDGSVTALDTLTMINKINSQGSYSSTASAGEGEASESNNVEEFSVDDVKWLAEGSESGGCGDGCSRIILPNKASLKFLEPGFLKNSCQELFPFAMIDGNTLEEIVRKGSEQSFEGSKPIDVSTKEALIDLAKSIDSLNSYFDRENFISDNSMKTLVQLGIIIPEQGLSDFQTTRQSFIPFIAPLMPLKTITEKKIVFSRVMYLKNYSLVWSQKYPTMPPYQIPTSKEKCMLDERDYIGGKRVNSNWYLRGIFPKSYNIATAARDDNQEKFEANMNLVVAECAMDIVRFLPFGNAWDQLYAGNFASAAGYGLMDGLFLGEFNTVISAIPKSGRFLDDVKNVANRFRSSPRDAAAITLTLSKELAISGTAAVLADKTGHNIINQDATLADVRDDIIGMALVAGQLKGVTDNLKRINFMYGFKKSSNNCPVPEMPPTCSIIPEESTSPAVERQGGFPVIQTKHGKTPISLHEGPEFNEQLFEQETNQFYKDKPKVKDILLKLKSNLKKVTFEEFYSNMKDAVGVFQNYIGEEKYVVVFKENSGCELKSQPWVYELIASELKHPPEGIVFISSSRTSNFETSLYPYFNRGIRKVVVFDDAAYSGQQLSSEFGVKIYAQIDSFSKIFHVADKFEYIAVVSRSTFEANSYVYYNLNEIKNRMMYKNAEFRLVTGADMPTIKEILSPEEYQTVSGLLNIDKSKTLTYFDFKVPDHVSFLDYFANYIKFQCQSIRYTDAYVPYKNPLTDYYSRVTQSCSNSISP